MSHIKHINLNTKCIYYDNTDDFLNSNYFFYLFNKQYQKDLLKFFNLKTYDDDKINKKVAYVYNLVKDDNNWKEIIINNLNKIFFVDDPECGFMLLFNYDNFYLTLEALKYFLKYKNNKNIYFNLLKKKSLKN